MQGFVRNVTDIGVFVGFLGGARTRSAVRRAMGVVSLGLAGLAPRGELDDQFVAAPADLFAAGLCSPPPPCPLLTCALGGQVSPWR